MTEQSYEAMIHLITEARFNQTPQYIDRIAIGICNEVYRVGLKEREVIARLSPKFKAFCERSSFKPNKINITS
jgi:hypothetical protein